MNPYSVVSPIPGSVTARGNGHPDGGTPPEVPDETADAEVPDVPDELADVEVPDMTADGPNVAADRDGVSPPNR